MSPEKIISTTRILVYSLLTSFSVLLVTLAIQWLVYANWLHESGPVRVVGTTTAAIISFLFVFNWLTALRDRHLETQRRFRVIAEMNDRIRNKLQAIECLTYASDLNSTSDVREAVEAIDAALRGGFSVADPTPALEKKESIGEPKSRTMTHNRSLP
jgi:hypothetical protein